jgi:hypothetical protein
VARKLACEGGVKTDLTEELLCLLEWLWYLVVGVAVILGLLFEKKVFGAIFWN